MEEERTGEGLTCSQPRRCRSRQTYGRPVRESEAKRRAEAGLEGAR